MAGKMWQLELGGEAVCACSQRMWVGQAAENRLEVRLVDIPQERSLPGPLSQVSPNSCTCRELGVPNRGQEEIFLF